MLEKVAKGESAMACAPGVGSGAMDDGEPGSAQELACEEPPPGTVAASEAACTRTSEAAEKMAPAVTIEEEGKEEAPRPLPQPPPEEDAEVAAAAH